MSHGLVLAKGLDTIPIVPERRGGVRFSPLRTQDAEACAAILDECNYWRYPGSGSSYDEILTVLDGDSVTFQPHLSFIAGDSMEMFGFIATVRENPWVEVNEHTVLITDVAVRRRRRGAGIGRTLLTEMLRCAALQGEKEARLIVDADATVARSLYASLGFAPVDFERDARGDSNPRGAR